MSNAGSLAMRYVTPLLFNYSFAVNNYSCVISKKERNLPTDAVLDEPTRCSSNENYNTTWRTIRVFVLLCVVKVKWQKKVSMGFLGVRYLVFMRHSVKPAHDSIACW